jgi:CRP/FNR family transcriptional regulator, cyclic AMP receptor protein
MEPSPGFWESLTSNGQHALASLGYVKKYRPGATLCVEGEPATHIFVLLNGWVKILSVTENGHEIIVALRGDGDLVGETAGEIAGRRSATMQALGAVEVLIVGYDRFSSFLDTHPEAARAYRRTIVRRLLSADTTLRQRTATTGAQRLAGLLLDLVARHGTPAGDAIEMMLPLSQEELASLAGTSRATVTRALNNWRRRGLIITGQRRITLIDVPTLRKAADPSA